MTQGSDRPPNETNQDSSHPRGNSTQRILIAFLLGAIILLIVIAAVTFR